MTWSLPKLLAGLHDDIQRRLATVRDTIDHPGSKGDASEGVWLKLLQTYLPQRYQAASPRVKVEFIDPQRDPLRTKALAQEFAVSTANTVVFASGDRKKYVTSDQLADYDYSGMQMGQAPRMKGFKGEEQFTSAILGVVNPKVPKVYFTTGHGEHDPDAMGQDGYSQLRDALKRDNLEVQKTSLLSGSAPADCDLLVIAGPTAPFADAEQLRNLIDRDAEHRALYRIFLDVRDAAAKILENTTLADIISKGSGAPKKGHKKRKGETSGVLPMVPTGSASRN